MHELPDRRQRRRQVRGRHPRGQRDRRQVRPQHPRRGHQPLPKLINVYDIAQRQDQLVIDKAALASDRGGVRIMANAYDIIIRPIITEQLHGAHVADEEATSSRSPRTPTRSRSTRRSSRSSASRSPRSTRSEHVRQGRSAWAPAVAGRRPQLEEGYGHPDRRFQDHRVLRGHGVRRRMNNGYQDL